MIDPWSFAQCIGYLAFVLGVLAVSQKRDRRLILFNAGACLAYALHFFLLGNLPATTCSVVSCCRSLIAMRTRSWLVALLIVAVNLVLGVAFVGNWTGWLPVAGACIGTMGLFVLQGIPMRLALTCSTSLWLANNLISGSIGGTALETVVLLVNFSTILRLFRERLARPAESSGLASR